jgi:pimeloyl-ACP methyl ester carboxylesterase
VLLVHGWESARDRTLPNALILHAIGIHVLTIDVRGHGANPAEELPLTAGEFGADALAGVRALLARDDVTAVGVLGHSMGGIGALLAAAAEPRVAAVVAASTPADPYRLTRQTFRLAKLPIPGPFAWPLAWLTTHVFLQPRGHTVREVSAARAIERYAGPVLLIHGDADRVVPFGHLATLEHAAQRSREDDPAAPDVEVLAIPGGEHSWLYEFAAYRGAVARFLTEAFGGPLDPAEAEAIARATQATRLPQREHPFSAIKPDEGGLRMLAKAIRMAGGSRIEQDETPP